MREQDTRNRYHKPQLEREALRDVIDLALWAGQLLLQHGAESARVEESVHRLGTALGADWIDVLVSPNVIAITANSGEEFRTKIRRVITLGVNMRIIDEVNDISRRVTEEKMDRFDVRQQFKRIDSLPPQYSRWQIVIMVGLACGSFSRLFGGDWPVFIVTFAAASVAMTVRQILTRRYFNGLMIVVITAFIAGVIASIATVLHLSPKPEIALASSVLLLVPGVQLINAAEDLIKGHVVTGITRGIMGGLISLGIALGLALAIQLMGVPNL